jgi:hypothetical protein
MSLRSSKETWKQTHYARVWYIHQKYEAEPAQNHHHSEIVHDADLRRRSQPLRLPDAHAKTCVLTLHSEAVCRLGTLCLRAVPRCAAVRVSDKINRCLISKSSVESPKTSTSHTMEVSINGSNRKTRLIPYSRGGSTPYHKLTHRKSLV